MEESIDNENNENNELLVKNETEYTYERYLKLNKFNMYKRQKNTFVILIISITILLFCGIAMLFFAEYDRAFLYIFLAVMFAVFTILVPRIQVKKVFASDNLLKSKMINTFCFYNDRIEVINDKSNTKLDFSDVYKAYETKDAFYIYLNKVQVYIISKECFSLGDSDKLSGLFKEKLDKNYVKKYKKEEVNNEKLEIDRR